MPTSYSTMGAHSGGEPGHQELQAMLPDRAEVLAHPLLAGGHRAWRTLRGSHHPAATWDGLRPGDPEVGERPVGVVEGAKHSSGYYQEGEQDHSRYDSCKDGGGGELRYGQEYRGQEKDEAHDGARYQHGDGRHDYQGYLDQPCQNAPAEVLTEDAQSAANGGGDRLPAYHDLPQRELRDDRQGDKNNDQQGNSHQSGKSYGSNPCSGCLRSDKHSSDHQSDWRGYRDQKRQTDQEKEYAVAEHPPEPGGARPPCRPKPAPLAPLYGRDTVREPPVGDNNQCQEDDKEHERQQDKDYDDRYFCTADRAVEGELPSKWGYSAAPVEVVVGSSPARREVGIEV